MEQATAKPQATGNGVADPPEELTAPPAGTIGGLRKLREQMLAKDHLDLEVPGYPKGTLVIRYKAVSRETFLAYAEAEDDESDIQLLIDACKGVLADEGDGLKLLTDKNGPLTFGRPLAERFELPDAENMRVRAVVEAVFGTEVHTLAVTNHAKKLLRWMEGEEVKANEGLLGK